MMDSACLQLFVWLNHVFDCIAYTDMTGTLFCEEKIDFWACFFFCRRYTKFYGTSERAAQNLVHDALTSMHVWFSLV